MIREPAVAGYFYPGNPQSLLRQIESFLREPEKSYEAKAIVAPHAGYIYSGIVAGAVYSSVRLPKRFILLGPNHTGQGPQLSLYPYGEWRTPLGLASIDAELTERLKNECPDLSEDRLAHAREHSLEVQIPFLQARVPEFSFAAVCVGTGDYAMLDRLGHAVASVVKSASEPILVIASSDMNHFESAEVSAEKDRCAIDRVLALDPAGLYRVVREKNISMCGYAPTVVSLTTCLILGATEGHLVRYANSGETSGDYDRVVGYAGMVIT
jgi:hypothetical protein